MKYVVDGQSHSNFEGTSYEMSVKALRSRNPVKEVTARNDSNGVLISGSDFKAGRSVPSDFDNDLNSKSIGAYESIHA